jgi:hypothetical protein
VTLNKFDPSPVLVNVNKLKPYQFLDEKAQIIDLNQCIGKDKNMSRWMIRKMNIWRNLFLWYRWYQLMELIYNR